MSPAQLAQIFPDLTTNDAINLLAHARFRRVNQNTLVDQLHCVRSDMIMEPGADFITLARRAIEDAATSTLRTFRKAANFHRLPADDFKAVLAAARVECDLDPTLDYERQALRLIHASSERNDVRSLSLDIGDGEDDGHACDKIWYESWQQTQSSDDEPTLDDLFERARIASLDARIPARTRNLFARLADGKVNDHDTGRWMPRADELRAMVGVLS